MLHARLLIAILLVGGKSITAQQKQVSIPFIGCRSDGQTGPQPAPKGQPVSVPLTPQIGNALAYYSSEKGFGVLAPQGWYCFGTYGSGGVHLFVSPQPVTATNLFSDNWGGFLGPAIQLNQSFGHTLGRFGVAEIIARVFPAYRSFATSVMSEDVLSEKFSLTPFPKDALTYKSKTVVEYKTPAQTEGLGTHSQLKKNDEPIEGVAILVDQAPDLLLLAVRLPAALKEFTPYIIQQVERSAARGPQPRSDNEKLIRKR